MLRAALNDPFAGSRSLVTCDWHVVAALYSAAVDWPFFELVAGPVRRRDRVWESYESAVSDVEHALLGLVAEITGTPVEQLQPSSGFFESGITSISALELKAKAEREFGLEMPTTIIFDHPTPSALALHLVEQLDGVPAPETDDGFASKATTAAVAEPVAGGPTEAVDEQTSADASSDAAAADAIEARVAELEQLLADLDDSQTPAKERA